MKTKTFPVLGGKAYKRTYTEESLFARDSIQFPRLIAEIAATQEIDFAVLCESMDLDRLDIYELFDRAEKEWRKIKQSL